MIDKREIKDEGGRIKNYDAGIEERIAEIKGLG